MTRTGVDLKVVADRLAHLGRYLEQLRALPVDSLEAFLADPRNPAAAESLLRRALESLFDALRHVLAKGFGEGALEYKQVAERASARGVVDRPELAATLREMAGFRNRLTHFYRDVTPEELFGIVRDHLGDVEAAAAALERAAERLVG